MASLWPGFQWCGFNCGAWPLLFPNFLNIKINGSIGGEAVEEAVTARALQIVLAAASGAVRRVP